MTILTAIIIAIVLFCIGDIIIDFISNHPLITLIIIILLLAR